MVVRLAMGRYCETKWDAGDSLTAVAIFLSIARIAFTHVLIIWKTNNVSDTYQATHMFSQQEIYRREIGSKFTLIARCLYISLLWIQKLVLLMFYRHLVRDLPWEKKTILVYGIVFAVTFFGSIISTFVECKPFRLYWQVLPDPGNCSQAIVQLYFVGICNMCTDLMLIFLPIPVLLKVRLGIVKKLQLGFLFSIGFMIIIITAVRIPFTIQSKSSESIRITWTTGEFLAATFVANAPKLYSFRHLVQRKNGSSSGYIHQSGPQFHQMDDLETPAISISDVATMRLKNSGSSGSRTEDSRETGDDGR
ncbi:hypothetical protein ACEPPN_019509 [Leptodophora sp. 'Broadleaf-Isolate-01']